MTDVVNELKRQFGMSETERRVRFGIGSAAAAAAMFASLTYKWKDVLTGVAAETILSAVYGLCPIRRTLHI